MELDLELDLRVAATDWPAVVVELAPGAFTALGLWGDEAMELAWVDWAVDVVTGATDRDFAGWLASW